MKHLIVPTLILLFGSCASKRQVAIDRQISSSALYGMTTEKVGLQSQYLKMDSSQSETTIQLFPIGRFSYSPDKGFEGEATSILLTGVATKTAGEQVVKQVTMESEQVVKQEEEKMQTVKLVENRRTSYVWVLVSIGLALLVYVYRKWKKFNYLF